MTDANAKLLKWVLFGVVVSTLPIGWAAANLYINGQVISLPELLGNGDLLIATCAGCAVAQGEVLGSKNMWTRGMAGSRILQYRVPCWSLAAFAALATCGYSANAADMCSSISPDSATTSYDGTLNGSVEGLLKIAHVGGDISATATTEYKNDSAGANESDREAMAERYTYLFCETITADTTLSAQQKFAEGVAGSGMASPRLMKLQPGVGVVMATARLRVRVNCRGLELIHLKTLHILVR